MSFSIEELKQQRAQIQKHLDWLDAKINALDGDKPSEEKIRAETYEAKETQAPLSATSSIEDELSIENPEYKAHTRSDLKRAKFGCLVFFCIATVIFLVVLFGLPYLW